MTTRDSASGTSGSKSTIVVLGQALASHGILTENDEVELYVSTMTALARVFGFDAIRFKAHPTVASSLTQAVARRFEAAVGGVLEVVGGTSPLEEVIEQIDPAALVGFFSTGLITVGRHFDIPVFQARAAELFQQLSPYANSNRIPALISALVLPDVERLLAVGRERKAGVTVDAVARDATSGFSPDRRLLEQAILAVGVTMQPDLLDFRAKEVQAFMRSPNWARIEPFMTCRDDHLVETDQYGALGPHAIRRAALRATNAVVGRVLSPRLMTKFDQDPRRFFSDSSNEWVRRIGLVYDGLLLDEDDSEG